MKQNYINLISACVPETLIKALVDRTGLDKQKVESTCLEVSARAFGNGEDLTRSGILNRLKEIATGDKLKEVLNRLDTKYNIKPEESSKVLEHLLPLFFKRISTLNDTYFDFEHRSVAIAKEEVKEEIVEDIPVKEEKPIIKEPTIETPIINRHQETFDKPTIIKEQPKVVEPVVINEPVIQEEVNASVDEVFKNIERKAEAQFANKEEKPLPNKKVKIRKPKEDEVQGVIDNGELSIIEKICIWAVVVALLALVGTIVFLFIKQNI